MPITLDYFRTHPLRVPKDQRTLTIASVRKAEKTSVHPDEIHPTAGAFIHYGGVELADMLVMSSPALSEPELQELASLWYKSCGIVAKQLLFYTSQIIVKELRHGSSKMTSKAFDGQPVDPEILAAVKAVTSSSSAYMNCVDAIGHKPIGPWVDAVERHFRHGGWGGAYGGKKWADIALVFKQYIDGDTSAMLAADRAWTLVHNTGPIFNKGFYFKYHDHYLQQILNAQASSSVFTLANTIFDDSDYAHECLTVFKEFAIKAEKAIQKVNPDYKMGSTGGVNSDGSKPTTKPHKPTAKAGKSGITKKTLGPFTIHTSAERID